MKNNTRRKLARAAYRLSAARLAAVQALYELNVSGANPNLVINTFVSKHWRSVTLRDPDSKPGDGGKARLPNPDTDYLRAIVHGVSNCAAMYEDKIEKTLNNDWTLDRLDILMRALLKSASFEFLEKKEVPVGVLIGEYTDLAHAFFNDKDAKFASSIINQLARDLRDT